MNTGARDQESAPDAEASEEAARRWQQLVGFANTVRAQAAHCVRGADQQVWPPAPEPAPFETNDGCPR